MTRTVIGSSPTVWRSWSRWRGSRWLRRSLRRFFSPFLESRCFTLLWQWNSKKLAGEGQREAKWCWIGHWTDLAKACSWYLENHIFLLPCTRTLVSSAFLMTRQGKFLAPLLSRHLGRPSQILFIPGNQAVGDYFDQRRGSAKRWRAGWHLTNSWKEGLSF